MRRKEGRPLYHKHLRHKPKVLLKVNLFNSNRLTKESLLIQYSFKMKNKSSTTWSNNSRPCYHLPNLERRRGPKITTASQGQPQAQQIFQDLIIHSNKDTLEFLRLNQQTIVDLEKIAPLTIQLYLRCRVHYRKQLKLSLCNTDW